MLRDDRIHCKLIEDRPFIRTGKIDRLNSIFQQLVTGRIKLLLRGRNLYAQFLKYFFIIKTSGVRCFPERKADNNVFIRCLWNNRVLNIRYPPGIRPVHKIFFRIKIFQVCVSKMNVEIRNITRRKLGQSYCFGICRIQPLHLNRISRRFFPHRNNFFHIWFGKIICISV